MLSVWPQVEHRIDARKIELATDVRILRDGVWYKLCCTEWAEFNQGTDKEKVINDCWRRFIIKCYNTQLFFEFPDNPPPKEFNPLYPKNWWKDESLDSDQSSENQRIERSFPVFKLRNVNKSKKEGPPK